MSDSTGTVWGSFNIWLTFGLSLFLYFSSTLMKMLLYFISFRQNKKYKFKFELFIKELTNNSYNILCIFTSYFHIILFIIFMTRTDHIWHAKKESTLIKQYKISLFKIQKVYNFSM